MQSLPRILSFFLFLASAGQAVATTVVSGRIVDVSGSAVVTANVSLEGKQASVDADGTFIFSALGAGLHQLSLSAEGFYPMVHSFSIASSDASDFRLPDVHLVRKVTGRRLFLFAGDAMLGRRFFTPRGGEVAIMRTDHVIEDGRNILRHVKPYVELADVASVNLETQLADRPPRNPLPKSVTFYSPTALPGLLQWAGFDYVSLGNNHMFDYRDAGLRSTLDALQKVGIGASGAGFDEAEARTPYVMDLNGREIAFLSYVGWEGTFSPTQSAGSAKGGAALGNSQVFAEDLARIGDNSITVIQHHSGLEYAAHPAQSERTSLRSAVDAGADVAIGHHAHVLQGFELYKNRLIAYSMGNFLFDQYHYTTQLGMLLFVWLDDKKFYRAEVVPLNINGYVPTPAIGRFRDAVLNRLARLSAPYGVCMSESGMHGVVTTSRYGEPQLIEPDREMPGAKPVAVKAIGASPLRGLRILSPGSQYRLGVDMLPRGDFESFEHAGTHDRSWIRSEEIEFPTGVSRHMKIDVPAGASVRAGMKVFERVFTSSNPATLSGRIRVQGSADVRFLLQRRRTSDGLETALADGPVNEIGGIQGGSGHWQEFTFDFAHPRIATRSIRLLIDVANFDSEDAEVSVSIDDLTWIEWRTPWIDSGNDTSESLPATHFQYKIVGSSGKSLAPNP